MGTQERRVRRKAKIAAVRQIPLGDSNLLKHPGTHISGGQGTPELKGPPGMPQDEIQYRMMLQEAILWVTQQVMRERREEIMMRAEDRVRTLQELRGAE